MSILSFLPSFYFVETVSCYVVLASLELTKYSSLALNPDTLLPLPLPPTTFCSHMLYSLAICSTSLALPRPGDHVLSHGHCSGVLLFSCVYLSCLDKDHKLCWAITLYSDLPTQLGVQHFFFRNRYHCMLHSNLFLSLLHHRQSPGCSSPWLQTNS